MFGPLKLIVDSPWYYLVLALFPGTLISLWLYFRNRRNSEVSRKILIALGTLRFISITLACILLLNIFLKSRQNKTEAPVILLAIDNSTSMVAGADSAEVRKAFLESVEGLVSRVSEKYEVRRLLFGDRTAAASASPSFNEKATDIDELFRDVENNYANQNVGAMIVASDGIFNRGPNPVYAASRLHYPIYTIAMGDTIVKSDVAVVKISHNQVAYLGNDFPIEVAFRAKQFEGKEVTVIVKEGPAVKSTQIVKVNGSDLYSTLTFTLNAQKPGIVTYQVEIPAMPGEQHLLNNKQSFIVEVIDNREKILCVASAPHPDIAAIRDVLNGTSFEAEYLIGSFDARKVNAYSLVIMHGQGQTILAAECEEAGVPYLVINPGPADQLQGLRISGSLNRYNDVEPLLNQSFGLFTISDALRKFISAFPAVKVPYGQYEVSGGANVLVTQKIGSVETGNPVMFFTENNSRKRAVFVGDGLWKWKMRDHTEHGNDELFSELISKSVQWLALKNDKSFFRVSAPKIIEENAPVEITAEVYNRSYEAITEPEVSLIITNSKKENFNYTFSRSARQYKLNAGLFPPGEYTYEASVNVNNEVYKKKGMFIVRELVSEKINTVADHRVLHRISSASGGTQYNRNSLDKLEQALMSNENIKSVTYSETTTVTLQELKWLFWMLLILLCVEWFVRKMYISI